MARTVGLTKEVIELREGKTAIVDVKPEKVVEKADKKEAAVKAKK